MDRSLTLRRRIDFHGIPQKRGKVWFRHQQTRGWVILVSTKKTSNIILDLLKNPRKSQNNHQKDPKGFFSEAKTVLKTQANQVGRHHHLEKVPQVGTHRHISCCSDPQFLQTMKHTIHKGAQITGKRFKSVLLFSTNEKTLIECGLYTLYLCNMLGCQFMTCSPRARKHAPLSQ